MANNTEYLKQKEAADYLNLSKSTVSLMTSRGEIPHCRIGRCVRYTLKDLDRFMENRKVGGTYEGSGKKRR